MNPTFFTNRSVNTTRILYTPSAFARASLLYVQEIGTLQALQPHISRRTKLDSFLFFVVVDGAGELHYEGKKYDLHAGDAVFIDCMKLYAHQPNENALWTLKWVHFQGATLSAIYKKYVERGGRPVFHPEEYLSFVETLDRCFEIASGHSHIRDMELNGELAKLLTGLMQQTVRDALPQKKREHVKRVQPAMIKAYIDMNFAEKLTLESLAARFFVEKTYLARIFKAQYDISVMNYIYRVRAAKAKELLRFSDDTIEQIGKAVGMEDSNYFSRVFKKVEGISPGEYRKQW